MAAHLNTDQGFSRPRGLPRGPLTYGAIAALFAAVGWLDFNMPLGLVLWLLYLAPIWVSSRLTPFDHRLVVSGAVTTMGLVATSFFFSSAGPPTWMSAVNRSIGVILVWIIALLLIRARTQEGALRLNEARASALVQASAQVLWMAEPDGRVTADSPSWQAFTGQTVEARRDWGWLNAVHPEDRSRVEDEWRRAVADPHQLETEYRLWHRDGRYRWTAVRAVPVRSEDGAIREWVGMHTDISERKQAEESLRQSEEQFRASFDLAAVGQAQVDAKTGCFIRVNDRFCAITGYRRDELLGLTPHDLTHPEDRPADDPAVGRLLRGETEEYHREKRYLGKHGLLRWVRVSARLIRDAAQLPLRTIAVVEDITERKEAEAALMQLTLDLERRVLERTKELTESQRRLRALASELNLAEQRERRRLAAELHDYLAQLLVVGRIKLSQALHKLGTAPPREEIQEADDIFDRSLTYTRSLVAQLVPPVLEQFGLSAALLWLGEEMRRRGLTVEVQAPRESPPLSVDQATLLYQSTRELLMNVLKHARTSSAAVTLECEEARGLRIVVRDEGAGFDQASAHQAVDKFGLFSIRERMQALGGSFEVQSASGKGTAATLAMPLVSQPESQRVPRAESERSLGTERTSHLGPRTSALGKRHSVRVLLVDDHAMVRAGLKSVLLGYPDIDVVGEAANGEEAVEQARELSPQVIVMDVNMPRLDGIEATRRILQERPDTIVIGLSVNASPQVAEAMQEAGSLTLLTKESAAELLYRTITRAATRSALPATESQEPLPFGG